MNVCTFSPDRLHRYTLEHQWDEISPSRRIMWCGLNPSSADEQKLDPTLRRIRDFSQQWGYTSFVMTNLFAYRATDPKDMKKAADPIGEHNDWMIYDTARKCERVVAAWGTHGDFNDRASKVYRMLLDACDAPDLFCLGLTKDGHPKHPLYVAASTELQEYNP